MKKIIFLTLSCWMLLASAAFGQTTIDATEATDALTNTINSVLPGNLTVNDFGVNGTGANCAVSGYVDLDGGARMNLNATFNAEDDNNSVEVTGSFSEVSIDQLLQGLGVSSTDLPASFKNSVIDALSMTINPVDQLLTASMTPSLGKMQISGTKDEGYMIGIQPKNLGNMLGLGGINSALNGFTLIYSSHSGEEDSSVAMLSDVKAENGLNLYWTGYLPKQLKDFLGLLGIDGIEGENTFVCTQSLTEQVSLPTLTFPLGRFGFSILDFEDIALVLDPSNASIGLTGDISAYFEGINLGFVSSIDTKISPPSLGGRISLSQVGDTPGEVWNNAFGIPGINLTELYVGTVASPTSVGGYLGCSGTIFGLGGNIEVSSTGAALGMAGEVDVINFGDVFSLRGTEDGKGASFELNPATGIGNFKGNVELLGITSKAGFTISPTLLKCSFEADAGIASANLEMKATDYIDINRAAFTITGDIRQNLKQTIVDAIDISPIAQAVVGTALSASLQLKRMKFSATSTLANLQNTEGTLSVKVEGFGINIPEISIKLKLSQLKDPEKLAISIAKAIAKELEKVGNGALDFAEDAGKELYMGGKEAIKWTGGAANTTYDWMDGAVSAAGKWFVGAGESFVSVFGGGSSHEYDCPSEDFTPPDNGIFSNKPVPRGVDQYRINLHSIETLGTGSEGNNTLEIWGSILIRTNMTMQANANPWLYNQSCMDATKCKKDEPNNDISQSKDFFISSDLVSTSYFDIDFVLFEEDPNTDEAFNNFEFINIAYRNGMGFPLAPGEERFHSIILKDDIRNQEIKVRLSIERIMEPVNAPFVSLKGINGSLLNTDQDGNVSLTTSDDGSGRQKWAFVKQKDEQSNELYYNIIVKGGTNSNEKFLSTSRNGVVELSSHDDRSGRQRWELVKMNDGGYYIKIKGGTNTDVTYLNLDLRDVFLGKYPQIWILNPFDVTDEALPRPELVGVGTDNNLYSRATLNSNWVAVPNSGSVIAVTLMIDGTILGVGTDNKLYTRKTLNSNWEHVPNSGDVIAVTQLQDGTILGVGMDNQLYKRATLNSDWVSLPTTIVSLKAVTQLQDGTILGYTTDNNMVKRTSLNRSWYNVSNSDQFIIPVTQLRDGTILARGLWRQLFIRETLDSNWVLHGVDSKLIISIAALRVPFITCSDGIQNQQEEGIDCGGPNCEPCPTCTDGILNQNETGIDCGGVCNPCPTCTDGIQNQNETGIDCGGVCNPCPTCFDNIQNQNETGIDCGGVCNNPCPSCSDGIRNQNETGVDCGGVCNNPCPSCSDGIQNQNETGIDCGEPCEPCTIYYKIVSKESGKVIDLNRTSGNIAQYNYHGGDNQLWNKVLVGDGYYKIVSKESGKVIALDISSGNIAQANYNGGDNQFWEIVAVGEEGYMKIVSKETGQVLDLNRATENIAQWVDNGGDNQFWELIPSFNNYPFQKEVNVGNWSGGWSKAAFFQGDRTFRFVMKQSTGEVHIAPMAETGSPEARIVATNLGTGWTTAEIFTSGTDNYLFLLKESDGIIKILKLNDDGTIGDRVQWIDWSSNWTHARFYSVGNTTYLFMMKQSTGRIVIRRMNSNGTIGPEIEDISAGKGAGFSTAEFYTIKDKTFLYLMKDSDGIVEIYQIESDGTIGAKVRDYNWSGGWTNAGFYQNEIGAETYMHILKTSNGITHFHKMNEDGTVGPRFYNANWSSGWNTTEIFTTSLGKYIFYLKESNGVNKTYHLY